jgi:hypothetical protein
MSKSSSLASNTTAATSPTASSIAMSRSSSLSSAPTSPAEALDLEGLKDVNICQHKGITQVLDAINLQSDKLIAGESNQQYLVFHGVTQSDLAKIDSVRPQYTRVTYYWDINLLIIKLMPTGKHELAHVEFGRMIDEKIFGIGMSRRELRGFGAEQFKGSWSSKEGDTCFKPRCRDYEADLPTIVIEAGLSEPPAKLKCDANWWLVQPGRNGGKVVIVVTISIKPKDKSFQIEKWENAPAPARPNTRANPASLIPIPIPIPTLIQRITIRPNTTGAITPNEVTGAPLVLHFEKIFLRQPIAPQTDFIFTANELAEFATDFWDGVK